MTDDTHISGADTSSQRSVTALTSLNLRALFVSAFFFGFISVVLTAAAHIIWLVLLFGVIVPIFFLFCYWAVGQFTTQAIEQQESFADSVYYLGFLFTLVSLFAALFSLRDQDHNLEMLAARFGLALITTIFGLLIRVTIVNFGRDIDDEGKRANESLTKGVNRFQAEVERVSDQLQLVLGEIAQRTRELARETINITEEQLAELRKQSQESHNVLATTSSQMLGEASKTLKEAVELMNASLLSSLREANEAIVVASKGTSAAFEALQETPKAYQERTEANIRELEKAQENLSRIIGAQNAVTQQLAERSQVSSDITASLNSTASEITAQMRKFTDAGAQAEIATRQVSGCLQKLDQLGQSLQRFEEAVKQGPMELEIMLPKLRSAMNEIAQLGHSGESSLRQIQQNLIGATESIIHHLDKK